MDVKYLEYLEEGTKKIIEIISSGDIGEDERRAIVEAFANELSNNIGNAENLHDYEPLLYDVSFRFVDEKITSVLSNHNASYRDYENAIKLCHRFRDLFRFFQVKKWDYPDLVNLNIDRCEEMLRSRQESTSISSKIIEEDRQIDDLLKNAQAESSVKTCDTVLGLISELEEDIALCKSRKIALPYIINTDTKRIRKRIADLRVIAQQKEELYRNIYDTDSRIHNITLLQSITAKQCVEMTDLCTKQAQLLSECTGSRWSVPLIRYDRPDKVVERYKHYLSMFKVDNDLKAGRESLRSKKQYKNFFAKCEEQKDNFQICRGNGWELPVLTFDNPDELLNVVHKEKKKREKAKKIKSVFIKMALVVLLILTGVFFAFRQLYARVPFDPSYISENKLKVQEIRKKFLESGFKEDNITEEEVDNGWNSSGTVCSVSIDDSESYKKGSFIRSNTNVVIRCCNEGRASARSVLAGWQEKEYASLKKELEDNNGFIVLGNEIETLEKEKDKIAASISINGETYTNEDWYIPPKSTITISYYSLKIVIGNDNSQFVGQNYEMVENALKNRGFRNVQSQTITTGYAKGQSVVGVTVNGVDTYNSSDTFDSDVAIIVKYSSDDREDATSILKNWQDTKYVKLESDLKTKGFANISYAEKETNISTKDEMLSSITINNENYITGDCFIPKNAPIKIERYVVKKEIGNTNSDFIGQDYETVKNYLIGRGFKVSSQKITSGWAKGNSVVGVMVNGVDTYSSKDTFDPNVEIIVKYSSDDRVDITSVLKNWKYKDYTELKSDLEAKGFNNFTLVKRDTRGKNINKKVSGITLNSEVYTDGDCFLQTKAPIIIEYFFLKIEIGTSTSKLEGEQYKDVVKQLKDKGFTNIHLKRANNLINGAVTKEGSIKTLSIDGQSDFAGTDLFDYDSEIVIVVNTFKNKGCEEITDAED